MAVSRKTHPRFVHIDAGSNDNNQACYNIRNKVLKTDLKFRMLLITTTNT
jgi:hypothetical protein